MRQTICKQKKKRQHSNLSYLAITTIIIKNVLFCFLTALAICNVVMRHADKNEIQGKESLKCLQQLQTQEKVSISLFSGEKQNVFVDRVGL